MKTCIVADDLTGAADTAAAFCGNGHNVAVSLFESGKPLPIPGCDIWAVDVYSRGCGTEEAYRYTYEAVKSALIANPQFLYKKLDSALRGNIGIECDAAVEAAGAALCIVCPAVPRIGRTTIGGEQRIDGIPVHETEMGRDPMNPVKTSRIADILRETTNHGIAQIGAESLHEASGIVNRLSRQGIRYVICDAVTDEHLDAIVAAGSRSGLSLVWAGAAGLAQAIARSLPFNDGKTAGRPGAGKEGEPVDRMIWFASGSQTIVTERQLDRLSSRCSARYAYPARQLLEDVEAKHDAGARYAGENEPGIAGTASDALPPLDAIFAIPREEARNYLQEQAERRGIGIREASQLLLEAFARHVYAKWLNRPDLSCLVLIGGETARSILSEIQITTFFLERELAPGIIQSRALHPRRIKLITKSGAFGDENALVRIWEMHKKGE